LVENQTSWVNHIQNLSDKNLNTKGFYLSGLLTIVNNRRPLKFEKVVGDYVELISNLADAHPAIAVTVQLPCLREDSTFMKDNWHQVQIHIFGCQLFIDFVYVHFLTIGCVSLTGLL
jgi:hypothetical protein